MPAEPHLVEVTVDTAGSSDAATGTVWLPPATRSGWTTWASRLLRADWWWAARAAHHQPRLVGPEGVQFMTEAGIRAVSPGAEVKTYDVAPLSPGAN